LPYLTARSLTHTISLMVVGTRRCPTRARRFAIAPSTPSLPPRRISIDEREGVEPFLHLLGTCQRRLRHLQGCKFSRAETRREFPNAQSTQFVRVSEKSCVHYHL